MDEEIAREMRHYQPRFFARLAQLAAPYSMLLFLIQKPAFCAPRPRLAGVLTTGHGLDFRFHDGSFRLLNLGGLGLPKALRKLLVPESYLSPPALNINMTAEVAAEVCWEHVLLTAQPRLAASDDLPALPPEERRTAEWLEKRSNELGTPVRLSSRFKNGRARLPIIEKPPGGSVV